MKKIYVAYHCSMYACSIVFVYSLYFRLGKKINLYYNGICHLISHMIEGDLHITLLPGGLTHLCFVPWMTIGIVSPTCLFQS
jgi:mannose/fructose/N-acetylgalactosamine-specific phosphotransferase system component IIC